MTDRHNNEYEGAESKRFRVNEFYPSLVQPKCTAEHLHLDPACVPTPSLTDGRPSHWPERVEASYSPSAIVNPTIMLPTATIDTPMLRGTRGQPIIDGKKRLCPADSAFLRQGRTALPPTELSNPNDCPIPPALVVLSVFRERLKYQYFSGTKCLPFRAA